MARMSPVVLPTSKTIRLERLYKGAILKPETAQLQLPIGSLDSAVDELLAALADLLPPDDAP